MSDFSRWYGVWQLQQKRIDELETENKKLRECVESISKADLLRVDPIAIKYHARKTLNEIDGGCDE